MTKHFFFNTIIVQSKVHEHTIDGRNEIFITKLPSVPTPNAVSNKFQKKLHLYYTDNILLTIFVRVILSDC